MTGVAVEGGISLVVNGAPVTVASNGARPLVDILREDLGLTGTKEACGEGECGSCAVLLDGMLVNSCLVPAGQAAGRRVVTVEGLAAGGQLAPLQRAFLEHGAVQCGMCTPGMLLAAHSLLEVAAQPDEAMVVDAIAGTLCRCTGYTKIIEGVLAAAAADATPRNLAGRVVSALPPDRAPGDGALVVPSSLQDALEQLARRPSLVAVAGGTDVMVSAAGQHAPPTMLDISGLEDLRGIRVRGDELVIGSLTTFSDLGRSAAVDAALPVLRAVAASMGAPAIRNRATVGGNCVTASPAGDLLPVLLATDAQLELASRHGSRRVAAEAFWTGYRTTAKGPGELLTAIAIPLTGDRVRYRKVGARRALAIAKVLVALRWRLSSDGSWHDVRVALGSVADRPIRAPLTEAMLEGRRPDEALADAAAALIRDEIRPIDDIRSSASYRRAVTGRVLRRMILEG